MFAKFLSCCTVKQGCAWLRQDRQQRDGAVWYPRLSGDVAVVRDARHRTFLLCASGIPHLASELVQALRADLPPETTCGTFAESKEAWFLASVARRNRLHLLARLADELGVDIAREPDPHVHEDWPEDAQVVSWRFLRRGIICAFWGLCFFWYTVN